MRIFFLSIILLLLSLTFYFIVDFSTLTSQVSLSFGDLSYKVKNKLDIKPKILDEYILFTGDLMLARDVENILNEYGSSYPFTNLKQILASSTNVVVNFEGSIPLVHKQTKSMGFSFSVNNIFLTELTENGITHTTLANNHSYDFGVAGFNNSYKKLKENNLIPLGNPYHIATSSLAIMQVNKNKIALIALDFTVSNYSETKLIELFSKAKKLSDYQVVFVHWGTEYKLTHSQAQELTAKKLINLGADLIIGHHPHVVEDIQMIKGVPVFFSLGNFVFDQYFSKDVQQGLLLSVLFNDKISVDLIPISTIGSRISPRPMNDYEKNVFLKSLAKRSNQTLVKQIEAEHIDFSLKN